MFLPHLSGCGDEAGNPVTQTTPEGDLGYTWDAANRLTGVTRPNQVTTSVAYDLRGACGVWANAGGGGNGIRGQGWGTSTGAAVTIGNTIYGGHDIDVLLSKKPDLLAHETNHTWQWARGGGNLGFLVPWLIGGGANACNALEQEAGVKGASYAEHVDDCR
ncbi:hypothetical protein GCM10009651_28400 [Microbacterium natoriense]|uniref:RHS repeat domain-containing protein n=1 Tax=Microbacterium sp. MYb72 TaxID=1848693 RepID=UPI000CFAB72D|nr:hypothetical protein CQ047_10920 [Microbacterium sp. MYb72]